MSRWRTTASSRFARPTDSRRHRGFVLISTKSAQVLTRMSRARNDTRGLIGQLQGNEAFPRHRRLNTFDALRPDFHYHAPSKISVSFGIGLINNKSVLWTMIKPDEAADSSRHDELCLTSYEFVVLIRIQGCDLRGSKNIDVKPLARRVGPQGGRLQAASMVLNKYCHRNSLCIKYSLQAEGVASLMIAHPGNTAIAVHQSP